MSYLPVDHSMAWLCGLVALHEQLQRFDIRTIMIRIMTSENAHQPGAYAGWPQILTYFC
jgi:hypothetical protein